jgi:uncharacterized membrane protein YfcA
MSWLGEIQPLYEYQALGRQLQVSALKLAIGFLIILFVVLDITPAFSKIALDSKWLPLGGLVSGFFGGLSGHQGAFRSMFLLKAGLEKERFVATGVVLAVMVDVSRLLIYGADISTHSDSINWTMVTTASASAFTGAYLGARFLEKITIRTIQVIVSALLTSVAVGLVTGLL